VLLVLLGLCAAYGWISAPSYAPISSKLGFMLGSFTGNGLVVVVVWLVGVGLIALSKGNEKPVDSASRTMFDEVQEVAGKLVVDGYRRLAALHGCAPTSKTSDKQILEMYQKVGTAFREVADQRNERFPAGTQNYIVWKFLQVNETLGSEMVDPHLRYEINKYREEGLRPDYNQDLKLF